MSSCTKSVRMSTTTKSKLSVKASVSRSENDASSMPTTRTTSIGGSNIVMIHSTDDFHNQIEGVRDRIVLVEFFAQWCGPCQNLAKKLEDLANSYNGKILIVKVDVDECEDLALEHDVSAMPTFMVMKNRKKLQQFSSSNIAQLESVLQKFAGEPVEIGEKPIHKEAIKKTKHLAKTAVKN